jgi:hypothetical protein
MAMGGQEIDYAAVPVQGLTVQRKFYVDPTADGVRILNIVSNPTAAAITTSVQTGEYGASAWGDLGSDDFTVVQLSSDGSQSITAASRWAITDDKLGSDPATTTASDPTLLHYWDGKGGSDRADFAIGGTSTAPATARDQLAYRWDNVTIEPGQTAVLMAYEVQKGLDTGTGTTRAFAKTEVDALASADVVRLDSNPFVSLYAGMSAAEIAGTRNWAHPPVVADFTAQDSTAGQVVNFDAAGSHGYTAIAACAPVTQSWDYGDGTTGAASSHSYAHGGSYTVTEKVSSACGSTDTTSRVLAIRPAVPALDSTPTAVSRLAGFAFSGDGTDGFSCAIDAGEFQPCNSPYAAKVADGNHTFALRQTVGGQTSDVVSYAWRLDRTALAPAITATPKKKTKSKTAIFKFTGEAGAKFTCKLDKRAAAACTSPVKYKRLKPGKHRFTVFQTDAAGNISTARTKRWTLVKPAPSRAAVITTSSYRN